MITLREHIRRPSGSVKTICVTSVLSKLGIPLHAYHSTGTPGNAQAYEGVIRRNGFALRSRMSSVPKGASVGAARKHIVKINANDPPGTMYIVQVRGHLLLIDCQGNTLVDTDPRKADRRTIRRIHAVWAK
jgi:hypothetical protein